MTEDSKRVAELEQRVDELEATVRGLTEELVDAGERIRSLEAELDRSPSTDELREAHEGGVGEDVGDAGNGEGEATKGTGDDPDDNGESDVDDIIVA